MNIKIKLVVLFLLTMSFVFGQNANSNDSKSILTKTPSTYRHSLGSSFFMIGNLFEDSPNYVLLTYGYQLTEKNRFFIEFNTWKYAEPLGTYNKSEEFYPGFVRGSGIGVGYQRFYWKGLFTTVQASSFLKQYHDNDDKKIQKGYQLYLQFVGGYRFNIFKERFYVEPAWALKYWPIDTNFPISFSEIEQGAPNYILEPSLNFGFRF